MTQISPWQKAKNAITQYVVKDLKENYGMEVIPGQVQPKAYRSQPDHILIFSPELTNNIVYVMYQKDYTTFCDERGNQVSEPIYYVLDKEKVKDTTLDKVPNTTEMSLVLPVDCLHRLTPITKPEVIVPSYEPPVEDADENISALTIRDLYAIIQNKPVSTKRWLNKVISQS